jgi:hypothetical protein
MSARLAAVALAAAAVVAAAAPAAPAATAPPRITLDRGFVAVRLGTTFAFSSTLSAGAAPTGPLVAHLNVVSLDPATYVDPEDWSTHRTRYLGSLAAGGSRTITWRLKAVNSGAFGVYVAVLPRSAHARAPVTGPVVAVAVAGRKTLNAGGILSVALGVPAVLGVLTVGLKLRRRRA